MTSRSKKAVDDPFGEFVELLYKFGPNSRIVDSFLNRHASDGELQNMALRVRDLFRDANFQEFQKPYLRGAPWFEKN